MLGRQFNCRPNMADPPQHNGHAPHSRHRTIQIRLIFPEFTFMSHSNSRRDRGFTLIEVLLVLVILVILASLVATNVSSIRRTANIKAAKAQIGALKTPLDAYNLDMGMYPTSNQGLQALLTPPADVPNPQAWGGPYLDREIPLDPWGRQYIYISPGRYNPDYDVYSLGPGGSDQTAIGNWSLGN